MKSSITFKNHWMNRGNRQNCSALFDMTESQREAAVRICGKMPFYVGRLYVASKEQTKRGKGESHGCDIYLHKTAAGWLAFTVNHQSILSIIRLGEVEKFAKPETCVISRSTDMMCAMWHDAGYVWYATEPNNAN